MSIEDIRREYEGRRLTDQDAGTDPLQLFAVWFEEAQSLLGDDCNAMSLATSDPSAAPSVRIVLLKGFGPDGFVFYTNYRSRKGREVEVNPQAAASLYWSPLNRQIRIEGAVTRTSREESEAYFKRRPRLSRLAAAVSPQSRSVEEGELRERLHRLEERWEGQEVPCPEHWGGYRLSPARMEFWQGRPGRLHDRVVFVQGGGRWSRERLAP